MFFFILSGANVDFLNQKLQKRTYTIQKIFLTTKRIKLAEKNEFAAIARNLNHETFIVYVALLNSSILLTNSNIYPSHKSKIAGLITKKPLTIILTKYTNFINIFSPNLVSKLCKHNGINNYAIEVVNSQDLLYKPFIP